MKKLAIMTGLFLCSTLAAQETQDRLEQLERRMNLVESQNKPSKIKVGGRIQYDTAFYSTDEDVPSSRRLDVEAGSHFRRLRLGASGGIGNAFSFKLEVDFAGQEVGYSNIYINYHFQDSELRLGRTKMPQGHEAMTSSADIYFLERSLATEAFSSGRATGLQLSGHFNERLTYQTGVYTDADGGRKDEETSPFHVGGRLSGLVFRNNQGLLHLGGHYLASSSLDEVDLRTGPESRVSRKRPIETGGISGSEKMNRYGAELVGLYSQARFQYEYLGAKIHDRSVSGLEDVSFSGHLVELGIGLTGEQRGYGEKSGTIKELSPLRPWNEGGFGAVELSTRLSWVDLNDSKNSPNEINGGKGRSMAALLTWVPVDNVMFGLDVGQLKMEDVNSYDDQKIEHYQLRAQVTF